MLTTFKAGDGRTLSYLRRGGGPLVVCVPGGPGMDPEAYFAPIKLPGYEMLVFAPRGTGRSSFPGSPAGYRIAGYVEDVESLRCHLDVDRLMLYGNSHGGTVALAYACAYPERVARLVISNAAARVDASFEEAVAEARRRFAETVPDAVERLAAADEADAALDRELSTAESQRAFRTAMACSVAREGSAETAYLDRLCSAPTNDEAAEAMYAEMLEGLDLLERADAVTAPALVIAGESDVVVPPAAARLIADSLPNARYIEFAGVGHFVGVEASDRFRATVCEFLSQPPLRAGEVT